MSVVTAELHKGLDWEMCAKNSQVMDSELHCRDQQLLQRNAFVLRLAYFQLAERMTFVVLAQIGNAMAQRFDDAAIVFRC